MEKMQTLIFLIFIIVFTPMIYMKLTGKSPRPFRKFISAIFIIIFVSTFSFIYHMFTSKEFVESFNDAYDKAQYYKIAKTPNSMEFGCVKKEQIEIIEKLAAEENAEEFKKYFLSQVKEGNCIVFKETEEIKLIESEIISGYVLVERENPKKQYWTDISTLREK